MAMLLDPQPTPPSVNTHPLLLPSASELLATPLSSAPTNPSTQGQSSPRPIRLGSRQLRGRNFLLGNKQGLMLHLPVANGVSGRSIHRSKWYGASRQGRKFLEAVAAYNSDEILLSRRGQVGFQTDGVVAERIYETPGTLIERFFVPDYIPGFLWEQQGRSALRVEPYIHLLFQTVRAGESRNDPAYRLEHHDGIFAVSRRLTLNTNGSGSEVDTGGTPDPIEETLCVAWGVLGGVFTPLDPVDRWRPLWYSLDATRRRYLKRLGLRDTQVVEHAPLWELAAEWAYCPHRIETGDGARIAFGFGQSIEEATKAARAILTGYPELLEEKRHRLSTLLYKASFSCGHTPTDQAYAHVLSRLDDCMIIHAEAGAGAPASSAQLGAPSILAGDAYFQEAWKRDENIALGGVVATGQYDIARAVIDSTWQRQDEATGRLPLRLRPGETPGYTSSDATLWALFRLAQYVRLSGDVSVFDVKRQLIAHFFRRSLAHTWQGLLPSGSVSVPGHDWETWMDTEFSARSGFPIEIQLLWLAALRLFTPVVRDFDPALADSMGQAATEADRSLELFRRDDYFIDHLMPELRPVELLTPNSYFWTLFRLTFDWDWEERSLLVARRELAGRSGVCTLARSEWEKVLGPQVAGLARGRRPLPSIGKANYHRGLEWNWLSLLFVAGELRHGRPAMAFDHYLARQVHDATTYAGLGGVSEVFDHRGPAGPDFQTWSMSALVESLQRFVGVDMDVPGRTIRVAPQKPSRWPYIRARKWYGAVPFDIDYTKDRARQELVVRFTLVPDPAPVLELVLPSNLKRPPTWTATGAGGAPLEVECEQEEHPDRLCFRLLAGNEQRVVLDS